VRLHGGSAPAWLFGRIVRLSGAVLGHMTSEYGPDDVLRRLSDPFWFQALGCVLRFGWHSSGVTTTTTGALKEAVHGRVLLFPPATHRAKSFFRIARGRAALAAGLAQSLGPRTTQ
jgi:hypothetical protein